MLSPLLSWMLFALSEITVTALKYLINLNNRFAIWGTPVVPAT